MSNKYFYSHLVDIDSLISELDTLELSSDQKKELASLAHSHIHQVVMDTILSQLDDEDKKRFLELVVVGEDDKVWEHLNKKVDKIEDKISAAAGDIKEELRKDIGELKRNSLKE